MTSRKRCTKCGLVKSITAFAHTGRGYLRSNCRKCSARQVNIWYHQKGGADYHRRYRKLHPEKLARMSRRTRLKIVFGMTEADYDRMLRRQRGRCILCRRPPNRRRLAVDHDHKTKRIRALLCGSCNTGLGLLQDNPALLRRAADYVERFRRGR